MDIYIIINCMIKMLLIMAVGFVLYRTNIMDSYSVRKLSGFVSKISAPLLTVAASLSSSSENRGAVFLIILAGFCMYFLFIIFGKLVTFIIPFPRKDKPLYESMMVCANCAFMGYPVLQSVLGDEAVFYSSMLHFALNIIIYTYTIAILRKTEKLYREESGDKVITETKESLKMKLQNLWRMLIGPGLLLGLLALFIYVSGIRDNGVIYDTCYMLGNTTSALSMLILGASFAQYPVKESLMDVKAYGFAVIRLLLIPAVSYGICRLIGVGDYLTSIVTITTGMPVGSVLLILGNEYITDTRLITRNIVVSTLLSVITIPFVVELFLIH